jgi:predicted ester cyclase
MASHMSALAENRETTRTAIERVCARGDMALAPSCYAEDFADYFANSEYHGLEGVRKSTELYRALLDDLVFEVVDQVAEDDRVANRWVLTGTNRGRRIRVWGITVSRLRGGRIVEDWTGFDSLALIRQLGLLRTILAAPRLIAAARAGS